MEKKVLCINVSPVSPVIKAWSVELSALEVSENSDREPISHPCTFDRFLEALRGRSCGDSSFANVEKGYVACDSLRLLPLLRFGALHHLLGILSAFGEIEIIPNGRGGFYIELVFDGGDSSLFEELTK